MRMLNEHKAGEERPRDFFGEKAGAAWHVIVMIGWWILSAAGILWAFYVGDRGKVWDRLAYGGNVFHLRFLIFFFLVVFFSHFGSYFHLVHFFKLDR